MADSCLVEEQVERLIAAMLTLAKRQRAALEQDDTAMLSEVSRQRDDLFRQLQATLAALQVIGPRVTEDDRQTAGDRDRRWQRLRSMARDIALIDSDSRRLAEEAMQRSSSEMAKLRRVRLALNYKRWSRTSRSARIDLVR